MRVPDFWDGACATQRSCLYARVSIQPYGETSLPSDYTEHACMVVVESLHRGMESLSCTPGRSTRLVYFSPLCRSGIFMPVSLESSIPSVRARLLSALPLQETYKRRTC